MNSSELVQLFFERSAALQSYWTLYVVIIGGMLAFSSLRERRDLLTTSLVTVLFSFFAYKNLGAILEASSQRIAALEMLRSSTQDAGSPETMRIHMTLEPTLETPPLGGLRNFHITSDLLAIAALWAMERRRKLVSK